MAEAATDTIPLEQGADGVMRIRGTRVTIDTVLAAFRDGATAEEIAQQYPSISLADVYQVIGYCLRHFSEFEAYLIQRGEVVAPRENSMSLLGRRTVSASGFSRGTARSAALAGGRKLQQRHSPGSVPPQPNSGHSASAGCRAWRYR